MPQLIESLKTIIFSEDFRARHKQQPKDFVRSRLLPFHDLIFFLINMNNKSYQDELDRYFQTVLHTEFPERILFKGNLSKARTKLQPQDLILMDRGYPAHWLFNIVLSMDANFCARISYKHRRVARQFYRSGKKEQIVKIEPSPESFRKCFEMGLDTKPIKVRLLRVELSSGETEILVTSLLDMVLFN